MNARDEKFFSNLAQKMDVSGIAKSISICRHEMELRGLEEVSTGRSSLEQSFAPKRTSLLARAFHVLGFHNNY
jgi:hypothetical protein